MARMMSSRLRVVLLTFVSTWFCRVPAACNVLTKKDNCYRDQYHENMMVTQERN
jgi:hypothetical protein